MMRAIIIYDWKGLVAAFGGGPVGGGLLGFRSAFLKSDLCRFVEDNGWSFHTQRDPSGFQVVIKLPEGESDYYLLKLKLDKPSMLSMG